MLIYFSLKPYFAATKKSNSKASAISRAPIRLSANDMQVQSEKAGSEQVGANKAPVCPSEGIDRAAAESGKRQKKKKRKKKRPPQLVSKSFDQVVADLNPEMMALNKYVPYSMSSLICPLIVQSLYKETFRRSRHRNIGRRWHHRSQTSANARKAMLQSAGWHGLGLVIVILNWTWLQLLVGV